MVLVQSKTNSSLSPLNISSEKESANSKETLSFAELLRGVTTTKENKTVQNGTLILSLGDEKEPTSTLKSVTKDKSETFLSLLKGEAEIEKNSEKIPVELNPKITATMTTTEIKELIYNAKEYLKNKITSMPEFSKSEIETLPKTLKGLVQVAQKFGIDVSKITLEKVKSSGEIVKPQSENRVHKVQEETKQEVSKSSSTLQGQTKITTTTLKTTVSTQTQATQLDDTRTQEEVKVDIKTKESVALVKETPLFKAQAKNEISTEQIVNARSSIIETKAPKDKTNESLKLLLHGDTFVKEEPRSGIELSVATSKAISPSSTTSTNPTTMGLTSLLKGETQTQENNSSQGTLDGLNIAKVDSLELKLNEAKQMVKYLSQDVKTAIEDYKSPFTRVKVQLNPQKLGEVDLTVVQRGKNLHISLSSNNSAINTLALNANELKMQLVNNGINNASLNFSNNPQSQDGSAAQQQNNHQQRQEAGKEYNYFESEEENEEILSSLEIVVPHYA